MEEEYLCQVCGTSQKESGKCPLCGSILEKIAMSRENGDYIDDDLLSDRGLRSETALAGSGATEDSSFEEDY